MAATNYDYSGFYEQRPQIAAQYHFGSCKVEAARGNNYTSSSTKEQQNIQTIHISNNAYYGHHPAKPRGVGPHDVDDTRLMDCDMAPISSYCTPERTLGRKRASDDVSYASFKRFRQEEDRTEGARRVKPPAPHKPPSLEELLSGTHGCHMFHYIQ